MISTTLRPLWQLPNPRHYKHNFGPSVQLPGWVDKCVPGKPEGGAWKTPQLRTIFVACVFCLAASHGSPGRLPWIQCRCTNRWFGRVLVSWLGSETWQNFTKEASKTQLYGVTSFAEAFGDDFLQLFLLVLICCVFACFSRRKDGQHGRQHSAALQCTLACVRGSDRMSRNVSSKGNQNHIVISLNCSVSERPCVKTIYYIESIWQLGKL